ncbi:uncharacterized protein N7479_008783 [Penicillium vulpinum]|uniref:SCP domain-containing protein n=1 Tax=Penicillium vulpinum TaxID=29845 RepID=A0A1V6S0U7_9EURO|nr:uncharacterized protein N7479_008783 [Penicillium vulpinum]KAJ5950370.1 hypothetical protein N7479_008783 [Penicillium vulpinum]OQE07662.1 hypothetical protein PENVUL_c012G09744 [Penicillium vulpinum]
MRSAVIFAALAVGTCAKVIQKEVYVTEWTTTTVTETVTQWPTAAANTAVVVKQDHVNHHTKQAAHPTVDLSNKAPVAVETEAAAAAASTTAAAEVEDVKPTSTTSSSTTEAATIQAVTTRASTTEAEVEPVTTSAAPSTTSVATTEAASTTAAATAAPSAGTSYQESILHYHNIHRRDHSSPDLTWAADLEQAANTLASRCEYGHDTSIEASSGSYGQNIAYGYDSADVGEKIISEMMYTREAPYFDGLYGQANPDMTNFASWGHFTQIVWKGTTTVGCATVSCPELKNVGSAAPYTVCNYGPPGNFGGAYAENVLTKSS